MPMPPVGAEPEAWLTLDLISGLGGEGIRALLGRFGPPSSVLGRSRAQLAELVGGKIADTIARGPAPERLAAALKWLEEPNNHLLTLADDDYPPRLLEITDPPPILYMKGRRELLARPGLAIVGSRNASPGGLQNAQAFARSLSDAGLTIISGMALGIDAAAHRGGLDGTSSSIAVVGTGLDLVYPARNKALARELAESGLIISEFSLGTPALAANFPRRNRIISGLSRAVLVVEAALASGSLITARLAGEQGRDVFAIPGSIHSPFAKGCHQLIKQGAKLVDDAADILSELQLGSTPPPVITAATEATVTDPLLMAMGYDPVGAEALSHSMAQAIEAILARLTELELEGAVVSLPGGKFQRLQ